MSERCSTRFYSHSWFIWYCEPLTVTTPRHPLPPQLDAPGSFGPPWGLLAKFHIRPDCAQCCNPIMKLKYRIEKFIRLPEWMYSGHLHIVHVPLYKEGYQNVSSSKVGNLYAHLQVSPKIWAEGPSTLRKVDLLVREVIMENILVTDLSRVTVKGNTSKRIWCTVLLHLLRCALTLDCH